MILLRLLSWQYARKHVLRTVLTVAGIALGVAVLVAMHTTNQAVLSAFSRTVDQIAGTTQLQVYAGDFGFPEEVLEKVQAVPEVRVAVPVIESAVEAGGKGQGSILILGVDMTGDRSLRNYDFESGDEDVIDDPLVFLAQPDSIILTREFADRHGLGANSRLPLTTLDGVKEFVVRGIMRSEGFARAFGGNLAVMDIYAAQKMFGRGRRFDRIDIGVKEGVTVQACQEAVRSALGPGFEVEPPSARGQHFEAMLRNYTITVNISSLFALFIGMFIIYNSFAIAVTQRRSEIGILRALGATQAQVRGLFLGESVVLGMAGSVAGVAAGSAMAQLSAGYIGGMLENVFGVAQRVGSARVEPWLIAVGLAVGVLTSVVSAWIPSRAAARVDPVRALQKGKYQVLSAGESRSRRIAAGFCLGVSAICVVFSRWEALFYVGYVSAVLTALLLAPSLSLWLSRGIRPVLKWLRPVEGALAADSLIQAPRRTSATVAALMLSLAMVIGMGGMAGSVYGSVHEWMATRLNPDLFVAPSQRISERNFTFPASFSAEIERMEGVDQVQNIRSARLLYRQAPVLLLSVEIDRFARKVRFRPLAGRLDEMYRLTARGEAVMVSDSFATLRGMKLGDIVELASPSGLLRLPIAGITRDFSDQQGTILIDRALYTRHWKDDTINIIRVYVRPGVPPEEMRRKILDRYAGRRLFVLLNQDVRGDILKWTDQWFGMTYNQIAVAVLVAVLGIVNTLTVSITDRRRELGVLRAVGGLRNQIRRTIWMEALGIGAIGLILGLLLGAVNLYYSLEVGYRVGGLKIDYEYPVRIGMLLVPGMLVTAFVSALWPAESAIHGSLVEALEYE